MEFRILGPLEVLDKGREVPLGPSKERALLGVLLLRAGSVVSRTELIDGLWGESPPPTAAKAGNVYVSQVRRTLSRNGGEPIVTRSPGYVLDPDEEALDATRFQRLAVAAREREQAGELDAAAALMREALGLWRGPALAGLELEGGALNDLARLEELRHTAELDLVDYQLALGEHEQLVSELERLVAHHPLDERLHGQLILALYRSGRQAKALGAYRAARETLVGQLGLEPSAPLQRLERAILNQDPALEAPTGTSHTSPTRSRVSSASKLPAAANPIVGRRLELEQLTALLTCSSHLVTITGAGGSGKTRLAIAVAAELDQLFPDGSRFVSLAGVRQTRQLAAVIASSLGARSFRDLSDRQTLLILDNFEHLLDAAPAVSALLSAAPAMKVLVTSRAPLRIDGEREYPLEPLVEDEAVVLLTDRARAVRPGFSPDEATRMICRRLDGLPLALELVATHLRSLAPSALLDRLDPRLPLLTSGRRDAPKRQRTLRATIAWSYNLLGGDLRRQFARLAVFAGSFSPDAAEAVAEATPNHLRALVEASLLQRAGEDRLFMLETIREFASERLEADLPGRLRARHAEFFVALAERACLTVDASGPMNHLVVMPEHDNFRAALEWSLRAGQLDVGLRLATALEAFWITTDPLEGMQWLERLLEPGGDTSHALTVCARRVYGELCSVAGDFERAERLWEESLAGSRACGDEGGAAASLFLLAICAGRRGDVAVEKMLAEQALRLFQRTGSGKGEAQVRGLLAARALAAGEHERGFALLEQAIELAHDAGFHWWEKNELCFLAERLLELGRLDDAAEHAHKALRLSRRIHDRVGQIDSLTILAHIAAERGEPRIAGRLWGVVEAEAARAPFPGWGRTRRLHAGAILAGADFQAARAEANSIALETAVAECIP